LLRTSSVPTTSGKSCSLPVASGGQPGDEAGVGDVAEELAVGDALACLGLERRGGVLTDAPGGTEGFGAPGRRWLGCSGRRGS
jgi:hypothetical protein